MLGLNLSNLELRSNLLSRRGYQNELNDITVWEVKDIWRRNPLLKSNFTPLTQQQQAASTAALFNGDTSVRMADGDRRRAWLELLAERVEDVLDSLEERADLERTFEVLCVTEPLRSSALESTFATKACEWSRRARCILARPEFKLQLEMIDERLAYVLGEDMPCGKRQALAPHGATSLGPLRSMAVAE